MERTPERVRRPGGVGKPRRVPVPTLVGLVAGPGHPRAAEGGAPGGIGLLADLFGADYSVAFRLAMPGADAQRAHLWAAAVFEGAPAPLRPVLVLGWRAGLGLRLGRPMRSADFVLGWRTVLDRPEAAVLAAAGPLIEAANIVLVDNAGITWVTAVNYQRAAGRRLWSAIAPAHERSLPLLLTRAARLLTR